MINNDEIKLLLALSDNTQSDGLVVYDRADVVSAYGEDIDNESMDRMLNSLRLEGFVVIKMLRPDEVCLKITENGRHYAEEIKVILEAEAKKKAKLVTVGKDVRTGKTFVEFEDDEKTDETEENAVETEAETDEANLIAAEPQKKIRGRYNRLLAFIYGFAGGIIASVSAILTYVYAFGG